jgi:L-asparaginase/Glu-tRNA(Gln) amidotransferase subunit D
MEGLKGLVIGGFGSGNLPAMEIAGLKRLCEREIPVLVITGCLKGGTILSLYEAGRQVREAGAREGFDLTPAAAVQKMMYALGRCASDHPDLRGKERLEMVYSYLAEPVAMDMEIPL